MCEKAPDAEGDFECSEIELDWHVNNCQAVASSGELSRIDSIHSVMQTGQ